MNGSRDRSTILPGMLINENCIAFMRRDAQDPPPNQTLNEHIEVHCQNHDPPPVGILTKIPRRQLASGKIPFHHRVRLLRLPATPTMSMDKSLPIPIHTGQQAEQLVMLKIHLQRLKGKLLLRHGQAGKIHRPHGLPYRKIPINRRISDGRSRSG